MLSAVKAFVADLTPAFSLVRLLFHALIIIQFVDADKTCAQIELSAENTNGIVHALLHKPHTLACLSILHTRCDIYARKRLND